jgi:cell division protein FtsQ
MRALMQLFRPANKKAGKAASAPARRRPGRGRPQRWSSRRRYAALALIAVLMAGLVFGIWRLQQSGIVGQALATASDELTAWSDRQIVRAGLTVQHVFVTGRGETSKPQVLRAMGVLSGQSILAFEPAEARQKLLRLGWVETARVERRLPDTIVVHLRERQALALWQHKGRHVLIDRGGKPITRDNLARFAHLPIVVGQDAPAAAADLIDMLSQKPAMFALVRAAVRIGSRRWDLRLKNGIKVHLPEVRTTDAWARLAELVAEHRIFERDVVAIDLRLPDRLVLRLTPQAAARKNKSGKET